MATYHLKNNMNKKFIFGLPLIALTLVCCGNSNSIPRDENGNATDFSKAFKNECQEAFGTVIPFVPCVTYEYEMETDIYGDPSLAVYFEYLSETTAENAYNYYGSLCDEAGYEVQSGYYYGYECVYADKVVKNHDAIELILMTSYYGEEKIPTLGVFAIYYVYEDPNEYPSYSVEKLLGEDASCIPEVVGNGYQYSSSFNYEMLDENTLYKALRIVVYNAYVDVEEEYFNNLKSKNFVIYNDFELDDENAKPVKTYPGYTGGAYDAYYYNKRSGELICGTYFTYGALNGAFIIDIFTFETL